MMCKNEAMHSVQNIPAGSIERLVLLNRYLQLTGKHTPGEVKNIHQKMKLVVTEVMTAAPTLEAYVRLEALGLPIKVQKHLKQMPHRRVRTSTHVGTATAVFATV
jgi:hypothetical protein